MKVSSVEEGRQGCLGRLLGTLVVLALILLVTVYFAARTEGGRAFVEDRLERRLGVALTVGGTAIGWPYALVIRDVASDGFGQEGRAGFHADEVRISRLHPRLRRCVTVHRPVLHLALDDDGAWRPAAFARLGELWRMELGEVSRATTGWREQTTLHVHEASLRWYDQEGQERASAGGVSFQVVPVRIPGRDMFYCRLSAYNVSGPDGERLHDVETEWLTSERGRDVLLSEAPPGPGAPEGAAP